MWLELWAYAWSNPWFWLGLVVDGMLLPAAASMRILKWLWPNKRADSFFPRQGFKPRVLLVHGSGASDFQWLPIMFLYLSPHYDMYAVNLAPGDHRSVPSYSVEVAAELSRLYRERRDPVTLIGASMGGLIAADAATTLPHAVKRVITIGSPFQGAPALEFLPLSPIRYLDMKPRSAFLTQLQLRLLTSQISHKLVCFGGQSDFIVPHTHSFPNVPGVHFALHPAGHWSGVLLPSLWKTILALK